MIQWQKLNTKCHHGNPQAALAQEMPIYRKEKSKWRLYILLYLVLQMREISDRR